MSHKSAKKARAEVRDQINPILRQFITNLRTIFKQNAKAVYAQFPKQRHPCNTCALNPATDDWKGWDATALNLQQAIEHNRPFYCHNGWPIINGAYKIDLNKAELCAGWATIINDPRTKTAYADAILNSHTPEGNDISTP